MTNSHTSLTPAPFFPQPASAAATPTTSAGAGESDSLRTPLLSGGGAGSDAPPRRPTTNERCALFDLDLTLLDVNTGRLWVEKEFREGKIPFQLYLLSIYWFAKYAAGFGVDAQEVAKEAMSLYGGQSSEAMRLDVETFWARECAARVRPGAVAALDERLDVGGVLDGVAALEGARVRGDLDAVAQDAHGGVAGAQVHGLAHVLGRD